MSEDIDISALIFQVESLIGLKRWADAESLLGYGLRLEPENYTLLCLMAQVESAERRWEFAYRYAQQAVTVAPERAWAFRLLGLILRGGLRRHEAVAAAQEAVRLEPEEPENWYMLVATRLHVFALSDARASAEKLRELAPYWPPAHQALALVALAEENYQDAEAHCRKELELDPNSYEGMNNLGVALLYQERKRDAVDAFHQAAKIDPVQELARNNLQHAVTRYLPRFGFGIGALYLVMQAFRLADGFVARRVLIFGLAVLAAVVAGFFLLRWYRFRRLPTAVRQYFNYATAIERREKRRRVYLLIAIGGFGIFGLWWVIVWALWEDIKENVTVGLILTPAVILCAIGAAGWLANILNRAKESEDR